MIGALAAVLLAGQSVQGATVLLGDRSAIQAWSAAPEGASVFGRATVDRVGRGEGVSSVSRSTIDTSVRQLQSQKIGVVVVDFGTTDARWFASNSPQQNAFEPNLARLLSGLVSLPSHPRVVLISPAVGASPRAILDTYILPLEKQAARESGVEFAELDETSAAGRAEELVDLIAPHAAKAGWHIVRASSQQADEGPARNAIDGDPNTYWHTQYDPTIAKPPHELVIDLGQTIWLAGFRYTPRQDGGDNGIARNYEMYVGDSPDSQTTLAAKGSFKRGSDRKTVRFATSVQGRYLRFVILSAQNRQPYGSAAEIDIIRDHTHE